MRKWIALVGAVVAVAALGTDAGARGGGGRGGRGRGRGGVGRGGGSLRSRFMKNRKSGSGKTAKEWELLRDQESRLEMIKERRARLMDLDRKKEQEAWLADKRVKAADVDARTEDVR
ncbi:MAG: hypothetical protein QNJ90_00965 [Planctomycetota bacterium]|nr:hypothetical protein [Planctomycetota bacterium]